MTTKPVCALLLFSAAAVSSAHDPLNIETSTVKPPTSIDATYRVDRILILGNRVTPQAVILAPLPFQEGSRISRLDLRTAERRLERLGIFAIDPHRGWRPSVTHFEPRAGGLVDVLIDIQEKDCLITTMWQVELEIRVWLRWLGDF